MLQVFGNCKIYDGGYKFSKLLFSFFRAHILSLATTTNKKKKTELQMRTNTSISQYGDVFNTVYISKCLVSALAQTKRYSILVFSDRTWGGVPPRQAGDDSEPYFMAWGPRLLLWLCCVTWTSGEPWTRDEAGVLFPVSSP